MVTHPAGAVVLVRFPFSDLSKTKLRPAVVLADVGRGDRILCQVTSKSYGDARAVKLEDEDFANGSLPHRSRLTRVIVTVVAERRARGKRSGLRCSRQRFEF